MDATSRALPELENRKNFEDHSQTVRRIFIGPMPRKKVVDETGDIDESGYDDALQDFVETHGHALFIKMGGKEEGWGEDAAKAIREQLLERLNASLWLHAKKTSKTRHGVVTQSTEWLGTSFEIGEILGVSMLVENQGDTLRVTDEAGPSNANLRRASASTQEQDHASAIRLQVATSIEPPSNYVTASEHSSPRTTHNQAESFRGSERSNKGILSLSAPSEHASPSSARSILNTKKMKSFRSIMSSSSKVDKGDKGKARVRYEDQQNHEDEFVPSPTGAKAPASPGEVLGRDPTDVMYSSAASAEVSVHPSNASEDHTSASDILMLDRMLVRIIRSGIHEIKSPFDDKSCRSTRNLEFQEWFECIVIWRKMRIEIYRDYRTPCKEKLLGHKRLSFAIPLSSTDTSLSLYSLVDFSFCLITPSRPAKKSSWLRRQWTLLRGERSRDIFIFRTQSRSRSVDWFWRLWLELGGEIPQSLDVSIPLVNVRLKVFLPSNGEGRSLTADRVIEMCQDSTDNVEELATLRNEQIVQKNRKLRLCWRTETKLDWIWLNDDTEGKQRDDAVYYGLALQDSGVPAVLELRPAEHYPNFIKQGENIRMEEPPAIEGYVYLVKPTSQSRTLLYLSTSDGWLFSSRSSQALTPPTMASMAVFTSSGPAEFRKQEMVRQRVQILRARGFWDLRTVVMVRRAFRVNMDVKDSSIDPQVDGEGHWYLNRASEAPPIWPELTRTFSDDADIPGDDALNSATGRHHLRMHRSFELVFKSGYIIRFEAHSRNLALEWITRLRDLISYWTLRHPADARLEMSLLKDSQGVETITPAWLDPTNVPLDQSQGSRHLPTFWNWCVLDACRSVLKSGRLFTKSKFLGQYVHSQIFLLQGQVVQYTLSFEGTMHHQRGKLISLLDAYVCSGFYAARELPFFEYNPNAPSHARIYADGLEAKNADEDVVFLIWYRKQVVPAKNSYNKIPIKKMSAKPKMLICRARSQLERDAWCWALNCEMERVTRASREREKQIQAQGMPIL